MLRLRRLGRNFICAIASKRVVAEFLLPRHHCCYCFLTVCEGVYICFLVDPLSFALVLHPLPTTFITPIFSLFSPHHTAQHHIIMSAVPKAMAMEGLLANGDGNTNADALATRSRSGSAARQPRRRWWHTASVYQIYPASFKDSNKDGWGDIQGIISKVDHIASLGVDAVWLSPCYCSPWRDNGYDISDYCDIDRRFGTMDDLELLIKKLKEHGIKLIMDLVVNHTSDQHEWFKESRSTANSPKRDWYIWRKGTQVEHEDGTVEQIPPNNWASQFGGSCWVYDEPTGEWYFHLFSAFQPDLNWENRQVRKAIYEMMRFWLNKGIGGFRMDVINMIGKPQDFPDAPITRPHRQWQEANQFYYNDPKNHVYLREMREEVLNGFPDALTVGETPWTSDVEEVRRYVAFDRGELDMVFQFDIFGIDFGPGGKFTKRDWHWSQFKEAIATWQQELSFQSGAWLTFFLESHDAARSISRFGDGTEANRWKVAKLLALLETTMAGTIFLHQGQEIGMMNYTKDVKIEDYVDVETIGFLDTVQKEREREQNRYVPMSEIVEEFGDEVRLKARDHGRIPIPWSGNTRYGGFTTGEEKPWMSLNYDIDKCNVAGQDKDPDSVLNFWRTMLAFRKAHQDVLSLGKFEPVDIGPGPVFAYYRESMTEEKTPMNEITKMLVVLNLTNQGDVGFKLPSLCAEPSSWIVLCGTHSERGGNGSTVEAGTMKLGAYEGVLLRPA
jgi:oligo-1,6-glucosidase